MRLSRLVALALIAAPIATPALANGNTSGPSSFSPTVIAQRVPTPPTDRGYLTGWVVSSSDRPTKYDALIGDAIFRDPTTGAPSAYNATPVRGLPPLGNPGVPGTPYVGLRNVGLGFNPGLVPNVGRSFKHY